MMYCGIVQKLVTFIIKIFYGADSYKYIQLSSAQRVLKTKLFDMLGLKIFLCLLVVLKSAQGSKKNSK